MVPASSIFVMALGAVFGIVGPFALAWWLVKKYKVHPATIVIGAATFIVFALGLESIVHQVVLKGPNGPAITGNIWYYALYGGLMAGLFEETGRFLAMKYLLKKEPSGAITGVAYGVGHGGAEILILFGVTMIANIVMSVMINGGHSDALLATAPDQARGQAEAQLAQLQSLSAGTVFVGMWERISALILHLGLSLMVWTAVRKGGKWLWLFPAAILLHCIVDGCTVILSKSAGMVSIELIITALAIAIGTIGYMVSFQGIK